MKLCRFLYSFFFFTASALAYDPLEPGPAPTSLDQTWAISPERSIPVRIFLPAETCPAPVILFSHGLGGSREGSNYLGEHWSSRGYVTVFLQHPGSDASVWQDKLRSEILPSMKRAASGKQFRKRIDDVRGALDQLERLNRDPDSPLHERLDLTSVGMAGHSFGAKTTQAVSGERFRRWGRVIDFREPRIDAALPMSPSPQKRADPKDSFGEVAVPWLLMTGTEDAAPQAITSTTPEDRLRVFPALPSGDKYQLVLDGAEHHAFTSYDTRKGQAMRNPNHHRVILATSTAFWDAYLKDDVGAKHWLRSDARRAMESGDRWEKK